MGLLHSNKVNQELLNGIADKQSILSRVIGAKILPIY